MDNFKEFIAQEALNEEKWMQKASKKMKKKGTEGSFTKWCKRHGFGGVNSDCIGSGLAKGGKIAKKAAFAKAAKKVAKD